MISYFSTLNPVIQALLAGLFTLFITTLGSGVVFFFKSIRKTVMDGMLSISAGIMLSASFLSLLLPSIEMAGDIYKYSFIVVTGGFLLGGGILYFFDKIVTFLSRNNNNNNISGLKRCIMLFTSITLHNIPEGLVIGVAFGAVTSSISSASIVAAITLTIGIAIQNFPEGSAISLPLRREGFSRMKAFFFGSLSAIVEPISAVIGALLVIKIQSILPFILALTAGAMIFVTVLELIPESQTNKRKDLMSFLLLIGFSIMMILEITLG